VLSIRIDNLLEILELEIEIEIRAVDLAGNSIKEVTRIAISPGMLSSHNNLLVRKALIIILPLADGITRNYTIC